ncbi:MAG: dTDP-4-dehydrorhamnose reductase [Desulfobacteraceae bacterium]|jgi:dTDP-4-dehydrorhamnose reductase
MKLLVTGANGQVGWELARSLMPLGRVRTLGRSDCDFAYPEKLPMLVEDLRPDVIVNAAAYTAVDKAEAEERLAHTINATAVGVLAESAIKANALLVHFSTDFVFDGSKRAPYREDDLPSPISAYGRSKLAGEKALAEVGGDYLVLRVSWVYAARGRNFVKTMLRLMPEREQLNIVDDQVGGPTWARNIADTTAHMVRQVQNERRAGRFSPGIFHLSASGATSWHGLATAVKQAAAGCGILPQAGLAKLCPVPTEGYPLLAARPKNSCLDGEKMRLHFGLCMPKWEQALKRCLDEIREARYS